MAANTEVLIWEEESDVYTGKAFATAQELYEFLEHWPGERNALVWNQDRRGEWFHNYHSTNKRVLYIDADCLLHCTPINVPAQAKSLALLLR